VVAETYELHFQEGFAGEAVEVSVNGAVVARFEARTRMQIGRAHVETVALAPGDEVTIQVAAGGASARMSAEPDKKFIRINLVNGELSAEATQTSPGYL